MIISLLPPAAQYYLQLKVKLIALTAQKRSKSVEFLGTFGNFTIKNS